VFQKIKPKRQKLKEAQEELDIMNKALAEKRAELNIYETQLNTLKAEGEKRRNEMNDLKYNIDKCELHLERAIVLIESLAEEQENWIEKSKLLEVKTKYVLGDAILSGNILTYMGPFSAEYRAKQMIALKAQADYLHLEYIDNYSLEKTIGNAVQIQNWNLKGLPNDSVSRESAIIIYNAPKYPLIIDPQGQANKWLKNNEILNKIIVTKLSDKDFLRNLDHALTMGLPMMIENVTEDIDPSLNPVLMRQTFKMAGLSYIKIGENILEFNKDFRLYMTSKLVNPHYQPEITSKSSVVNFMITKVGLVDQLLELTVQKEKAELEDARSKLIVQNHQMNEERENIESKVLETLQNVKGSILDDENAINVLKQSAENTILIKEKQAAALDTERQIDEARRGYLSIAQHGTVLFFSCVKLISIKNVYQYS
jgi:dynein heavy chain